MGIVPFHSIEYLVMFHRSSFWEIIHRTWTCRYLLLTIIKLEYNDNSFIETVVNEEIISITNFYNILNPLLLNFLLHNTRNGYSAIFHDFCQQSSLQYLCVCLVCYHNSSVNLFLLLMSSLSKQTQKLVHLIKQTRL